MASKILDPSDGRTMLICVTHALVSTNEVRAQKGQTALQDRLNRQA